MGSGSTAAAAMARTWRSQPPVRLDISGVFRSRERSARSVAFIPVAGFMAFLNMSRYLEERFHRVPERRSAHATGFFRSFRARSGPRVEVLPCRYLQTSSQEADRQGPLRTYPERKENQRTAEGSTPASRKIRAATERPEDSAGLCLTSGPLPHMLLASLVLRLVES